MPGKFLQLCHLDRAALGDATQRAIAHDAAAAIARAQGHDHARFDYRELFCKLTPEGKRVLLRAPACDVLETAAQCWVARAHGFVLRMARAAMYAALAEADKQSIEDRISQAQVSLKTQGSGDPRPVAVCA